MTHELARAASRFATRLLLTCSELSNPVMSCLLVL